MAEAKAPATSYLSGEDPDIVEANRRYQEAMKNLTESLDVRKNRFFDPTLLAMAEGFLGPTQTGSFGEALGRVAGKLGPAEAAALKEKQDIAQQQVAVAGQGIELQRLKARDAALNNYLNPNAPAAPTGPLTGPGTAPIAGPRTGPLSSAPAAPSEAPVGALSQAVTSAPIAAPVPLPAAPSAPAVVGSPQGALTAMESNKPPGYEGVEGIQVAPANSNFMTGRDYVRLNRYDKSKSPGDLIKEGQEIEQKRYRDKEGGVLDLATGKFYQFPTGKTEEIQLYGYPGTHKVDARTAAKLSMLAANDDPEYHTLAKRIVEGPRKKADAAPVEVKPTDAGGKPSEAVVTPSVSGGSRKSVQELATDQKVAEKFAEAEAAEEIENRKDFNQRSKDSSETLATANVMRRFTEDKNFKNMTGILNNDKVFSGIAKLVQDGIGGRNFTIGIPAIEDVMRNAKLTPDQQATYRTFLMYTAQMQLNAEKAMKGSTTERERLILGNANISPQDTAETVRRKADLLTAKAQFDRQAARAFKSSKMTAKDFLDSDQYLGMYDKYYEDISSIAVGLKAYQGPTAAPAATSPSTPTGSLKAAQDRVRQELNKK